MSESYKTIDGYSITPRGFLYPESLDQWAQTIVPGTTDRGPDVMLFARGMHILRLFVEPCTVEDRHGEEAPRYILEQTDYPHDVTWTPNRLQRAVKSARGFNVIYEGDDARFVARSVLGPETIEPVVASDEKNAVVNNATYPRVLQDMSSAHVDVTEDESEIGRILFLTPSGQLLELWVQPACIEARHNMDGIKFWPDDTGDIEGHPRFVLTGYTGRAPISSADQSALESWYFDDDNDESDWETVWSGEDPRELIREFEEISMGTLDWRPLETIPEDHY